MPRSANTSVQNTFSKALITEASGLNFPEDAVTETFNCIFDEKGAAYRRLGINFEADYSAQQADRADSVVTSYYWKAAAGSGDNALAVIQVGETLYFYLSGSAALSSDMVDTLDLTAFNAPGAGSPGTVECQFASGNGLLFVSHPTLETFFVEYDPDTETVSGTAVTIQIRDFFGVDDGLEVDERPTTLSAEHEYNVKNQGWWIDDVFISFNDSGIRGVPLDTWDAGRSDFPANSDIWFLHMAPDSDSTPTELFTVKYAGHRRGNTPAPKGHYILDAFYQDRSDVSDVSGLDVISSDGYRPNTIAFFAGRVWYSGVQGQEFSNKVYFTQIIESNDQLGYCYQTNDPTARDTFDLLPTDGGVITIPEAGTVIRLWAIENSILVFASNGIWGITGSEGIGFRANDYSVRKLSSVTALSASSFVNVTGYPAWWNEEGIYIASVDNVSGSIQVQPITDGKIKEFYQNIPATNKRFAKGSYNSRTRTVQWVYRSAASSDLTDSYSYDSVLNFNILTQGFYPWSLDTTDVSINGIIVVEGQGSTTALEDVTDSSLVTVTTSDPEDVQTSVTTTFEFSAVTKYICSNVNMATYDITFADQSDSRYVDWFDFDDTGVDFSSYFVSGYSLHGDAQRKFQPTYVYLFNETDSQENTIDFISRWDFATSGDTGRWSATQRLVFPDGDYTYQIKRIKTRGHGKVLQFHVASVSGEPFKIIGWSLFETQNQNV